jgi:hypothetical protein
MKDLDDLLADVFDDLARSAPHDQDLAAQVRRRVRRGRIRAGGALLAGAAAAVVGTGLVLHPAPEPGDAGPGVRVVNAPPGCVSTVVRGVLPEWARAGFTAPEPVMPYVRSASGNIVAILFVDKLTAPPRENVNNKILWVWRAGSGVGNDVHVVARLGGTGPAVTKGLPTLEGPSIVDLPSPGCWRLTISWPGGSDTIDLTYVKP